MQIQIQHGQHQQIRLRSRRHPLMSPHSQQRLLSDSFARRSTFAANMGICATENGPASAGFFIRFANI